METRSATWLMQMGPVRPRPALGLIRGVLLTAATLLTALATLLAVRRIAGSLHRPLSALGFLLVAAVLVISVALARRAWSHAGIRDGGASASIDMLFQSLPTLALLLVAFAVSLPRSPTVGLVAVWTLLLGSEAVGWWNWWGKRGRFPTRRRPTTGNVEPLSHGHVAELPSELGGATRARDTGEEELLASGELQRITRVQEAGGEVVYGLLRCDFSAGQRQQNVHVGFCPPLEQRPVLTADQVTGPETHIKTTLVETFGACLEVRLLASSSAPASVQIQFSAAGPPATAGTPADAAPAK